MNFPKYPAYKDSGVEWLGEVPAHWVTTSLKYLAELNPKKSEYQADQLQMCSFIPMEKLKHGMIELDEERVIADVIGGYTYFEDGDVLQAKVTPCFENKNIAIAHDLTNGIGFGSSEINVLRPFRVDGNFLYYRLQESAYMSMCIASMIGAGGLKRVPGEVINGFILALPTQNEQTQIARFLDHETARIDALIEEQQRLIELLKEKRQAVISHAVTKGLDPNVPMKDSGVEWLGEVPAPWEVIDLKYVIKNIGQGWSPQCDNFPAEEGEWGVLKVGCVNGGLFNADENKRLPDELEPAPELTINQDEVLVSRANTRELVGSAAVVDKDYPLLMLCDKLYRLRLISDKVIPQFLSFYLGGNVARSQIELSASGASDSMQNISQSAILDLPISLPPYHEQDWIVGALKAKLERSDQLSVEVSEQLSLLQERRSALISAAVTGKIDVRGWQPPKPDSVSSEKTQQTCLEAM